MVVKAKDVIGLKVITLRRGRQVDDIQDVIYNPRQNKVVALLVDKGGWFSSAKVILIEDVTSIGKDAVIIESSDLLSSVEDVEKSVNDIARSDTYLTKTKVVTEDGNELGKVSDIYFDSGTGEVVEFEVSSGAIKDAASGKKLVRFRDIITVGQDATIVKDYTEMKLEEQARQQGITGTVQKLKQKAPELVEDLKVKAEEGAQKVKETASEAKDKGQDAFEKGKEKVEQVRRDEQVQMAVDDVKEGIQEAGRRIEQEVGKGKDNLQSKMEKAKDTAESKFEKVSHEVEAERQNQAVGKFLTRTVLAPDDTTIGERGEMITHEMLKEAEAYGLEDIIVENSSKEPVIMEAGTARSQNVPEV